MAKKQVSRTTVIMPKALGMNLDLFCLQHQGNKQEVVCEAVSQFLKKRGYKPDQVPIVTYSWPEESKDK